MRMKRAKPGQEAPWAICSTQLALDLKLQILKLVVPLKPMDTEQISNTVPTFLAPPGGFESKVSNNEAV